VIVYSVVDSLLFVEGGVFKMKEEGGVVKLLDSCLVCEIDRIMIFFLLVFASIIWLEIIEQKMTYVLMF